MAIERGCCTGCMADEEDAEEEYEYACAIGLAEGNGGAGPPMG